MAFGAIILFCAVVLDRLIGDPRSRLHPVALLGTVIGWWGKTNTYPKRLERITGIVGWLITVLIFILPFLVICLIPETYWYIQLPLAAVLLSFCFASRSLEEHVAAVETALGKGDIEGRAAVQMLVSRDVKKLSTEQIRSAAYESAAENLVDSIVAPIFWFAVFELLFGMGIVGAALFRAANTMDAMLGYTDDRIRIGWFSARMDDGRDAIRKFILIGDQKQLPAVVMQSEAEAEVSDPLLREQAGVTNCRISLFERLLKLRKGDDRLVYCMEKQGRMHPDVSRFPNMAFYQTRLKPVPLTHQCHELHFPVHAGEGLEFLLATRRILFFPSDYPPPSHSIKVNLPEARLIAEIVHTCWELYRKNGKTFSSEQTLGIIVPYRNQIALIRKEIARYAVPELNRITIDTVERYQGSEREVIIYGFTIQKQYQLVFLTENAYEEDGEIIDRKLNVALTRAREQLVLVGNPALLNQNETFRKLIAYVGSLS